MKAQNTNLQKLEHIPNTIKHLTWLADGRLAYTVKDERDRSSDPRPAPLLSITDLAGTETKWFSMQIEGSISASPTDANRILLIRRDYVEMWSLEHDHHDWILPSVSVQYSVKSPATEANHLVTWAPDGKHLAVIGQHSRYRPVPRPQPTIEHVVYVFDASLKLIHKIEPEMRLHSLAWLPDNVTLTCYEVDTNKGHLFKIPWQHSFLPSENITKLEYRLRGDQICFTAITESEGGITDFCYHTPERPMMILQRYYATSDMGSYRWSRWSPDGTWIIYNSHLLKVVRLYNVDTEEMFTVEHESLDLSQATPSWSNDSRYCALATEEGVYILDVCAP